MPIEDVLWKISYRNVLLYSLSIPKPEKQDQEENVPEIGVGGLARICGVKPNANSKR